MVAWATSLTMAGVFAADQALKHVVEQRLDPYAAIPVMSNFNLVLVYNRGVSFGLLSSQSPFAPYILAFAGLLITIALSIWAFRTDSLLQRAALALIVGGAASNVVDRLVDGAVTDFLDLHVGTLHWPAFNLADTAIVCGVCALLVEGLFPAASNAKDHAQ